MCSDLMGWGCNPSPHNNVDGDRKAQTATKALSEVLNLTHPT